MNKDKGFSGQQPETGSGVKVKPGYKMTEVGVIPEEWEVATIGDTCDICVGKDLLTERFATISDQKFKYPVYSNTVTDKGLYGFYSIPEYEGDSVTVVGRGVGLGTAFARTGGYGAIGRLLVLLPFEHIDVQFLATYINQSVAIFTETGGIPQLTGIQFSKYLVALPPFPEQRAIATALSDVEALLSGLDRLIAKKRDLKQAAMQQLLTGTTRLPGFSGEWEVKKLGEVGDIRSGGTPSTTQSHFWDGDVPWCTPTDITGLHGRKYLIKTDRTISAAGLKSSSAEIIPPMSLIMTSRATIGECAVNRIEMTTNQGFKNIVPFPEIDVEFLYYLMTKQKNRLVSLCGGSTFLEISKKQLYTHEILLPKNQTEQSAIAAVLSDMDAEIAALEARRDKTWDLKQAMMQELLTGRTRLI